MGKRTCCTFPGCEEPKHQDEAMCREHTRAWMRSKAFESATTDRNVRFAFALSKEMGMREVAKHRRRWAKAEAAREEEGA